MDLELKKAFSDLQRKTVEVSQKLHLREIQIAQAKRLKLEHEHSLLQVSRMAEDSNVFESVGRAFFKSSLPMATQHIADDIKTLDDNIGHYTNDKLYLSRTLEQSQDNLREMVQQKTASAK